MAGQPGQLSLQNVVSIIISRAGRKAMTYTDLLGIGGLVYLLGKYVDTFCCMVSCFEPIVLIAVTLVLRMNVSICCYGHGSDCWFITEKSFQINYRLCLTFGGMCLLPQHRGGMSFCRHTAQ